MASKPRSIAAGFLTAIVLYAVLSIIVLLNLIFLQPALSQLLDFGSFIAAGREAAGGRDPYAADSDLVYRPESQQTGQTLPSPNLNPPLSVVFFKAISGLDPLGAVSAWRYLSIAIFVLGILILGWRYRKWMTPLRILWAVALAGFWNTLALGQIYAPIFLCAVGAWIFLEKGRMISAGILLGALIAIKPNFAFWLLLLGVAGYGRTLLSAIVTSLLLSFLPLVLFGPQIYRQWFLALMEYPALGLTIAGNSSLQSLAVRGGVPNLATFLVMGLIAFCMCFAYRYKDSLPAQTLNALGIVSSILISPFAWAGYAVLTLPIFLSKQTWNLPEKLAASCLVFPYVLVLYLFRESLFNSLLFGWIYGWGLLLTLAGALNDYRQSHTLKLQTSTP